jgi:hypothetical protein
MLRFLLQQHSFIFRTLALWGSLVLVLEAVTSCTLTENPALVTAGFGADSIRIQFINLAFDAQPRTLTIESGATTTLTPFATASNTIVATNDSARMSTARSAGGASDYQSIARMRFARNSFQTVIALPTANRVGMFGRDVDTLITFNSPTQLVRNNNFTAQVRLVNAMPDSTVSYSIRLGCPNGTQFIAPALYRQASLPADMPAGNIVVAVMKHTSAGVQTLEVDSASIEPYRSYALIIYRAPSGRERTMLFDERGREQALRPIAQIAQPFTLLRAVNISSRTVSIARGTTTITTNLAPNSIAPIQSLTACATIGADTLTVRGAGFTSTQFAALAPLQRSTIIAIDSVQSVSSVIVPPLPATIAFAGVSSAIVRIVNAMQSATVDVALAGRMTQSGFSSGTTLQSNTAFQSISDPIIVEAGHAPFVVFTSAQPAQLLYAGAGTFRAGKQYIVVVSGDTAVRSFTMIDEDAQVQSLIPINRGNLMQIVNGIEPTAVPSSVQFSINNSSGTLLQNAPLLYGNSLATVVPIGITNIVAGNAAQTLSVTATSTDQLLVIASGQSTAPDLQPYTVNTSVLRSFVTSAMWNRYINSARDVGTLMVSADSVGGAAVTGIQADFPARYRFGTNWRFDTRDRRRTLVFWEQESRRIVKRVENARLQTGRNYSVILIGRNAPQGDDATAGYDVMFLQEY